MLAPEYGGPHFVVLMNRVPEPFELEKDRDDQEKWEKFLKLEEENKNDQDIVQSISEVADSSRT